MVSRELKKLQITFVSSWRIWNGSNVFIEKIALTPSSCTGFPCRVFGQY